MRWVRGDTIGRGSFATVSLAASTAGEHRLPPLMAVKSCGVEDSDTLRNEREVLSRLGGDCNEVVRFYGHEYSCEGGKEMYNLLLEYADGGSLADYVRDFGALVESDVKRHTRSILRGIDYIHGVGFVHCDVKLQNLLLCSSDDSVFCAKIGDFGLAKKVEEVADKKGFKPGFRGTPLYMSPECLSGEEHDLPADIWALGCAVVEMATGKPAWQCQPGTDANALLFRIWGGKESPAIPSGLSEEGKDFLEKCFLCDPRKRWTARMLLDHPFVAGTDATVPLKQSDEAFSSPRCPFDFPEWASDHTPSPAPVSTTSFHRDLNSLLDSSSTSPAERIRRLAMTDQTAHWPVSESWITVR